MKLRLAIAGLTCIAMLSVIGCRTPPGRPQYSSETKRPDQVLDFPTLYAANCAGCHGAQGRRGAAISLANPVYLGLAGSTNMARITADGVPGTMMPPFARSAGGLLTNQQIQNIAQGMLAAWGKPSADTADAPPYAATTPGNVSQGQVSFVYRCASCHGDNSKQHTGSLVDPAYLALVSDQGLRSIVISGQPEQGMPDWHSYTTGALTDAEVTDIVAWLASKRIATPGQPYQQRP
jgi:cytochrome c oxidase cbb3-type subunit 3/ubiquinol-cytochrome c reductase cytochrome c subunit